MTGNLTVCLPGSRYRYRVMLFPEGKAKQGAVCPDSLFVQVTHRSATGMAEKRLFVGHGELPVR